MVKYLHVRSLDDNNLISTSGGITVAYTCTDKDICMAVAACNHGDHFNYDVGRRIAKGRLQSSKCQPIVIALKHPITETIVEHLELEWFDVPIHIFRDHKHRWVSDFAPDDGEMVETDWEDEAKLQIPDDAYLTEEDLRYGG